MKRSHKLVGRLACRDPTEDLDEVQPSSREKSASSEWDLDVEDLYDDQTVLSQVMFLPYFSLHCYNFPSDCYAVIPANTTFKRTRDLVVISLNYTIIEMQTTLLAVWKFSVLS